jgi:hypothetical protein
MALVKLEKKGYGQLELNFAAFRRSGDIEAKCRIADGIDYIENGMLLAVNRVARTVGYPTGAEGELIALNYTTEHMYDERYQALRDFKLDANTFLPRVGYIGTPDKFTTNTVCFDDADFADEAAALAGAKFGVPCENGYIRLVAERPATGFAVEVLAVTTMPDGQKAVKFGGLN